jgi:uncharacterized protein YjiS (DUF1127 family)
LVQFGVTVLNCLWRRNPSSRMLAEERTNPMTFGSHAFHSVLAGASRAAAWPFRVAAARATLRTLGQMDCRELADIGLTRCDLRDASALPLDRDPSELLVARARERQANALTAPPTAWDTGGSDEGPRGQPGRNRSSPRPGSSRPVAVRTN